VLRFPHHGWPNAVYRSLIKSGWFGSTLWPRACRDASTRTRASILAVLFWSKISRTYFSLLEGQLGEAALANVAGANKLRKINDKRDKLYGDRRIMGVNIAETNRARAVRL
jgi:hypothetical protein